MSGDRSNTGASPRAEERKGAAPEAYPRSWGDYLLLERLGSGGMSEVDLARKRVDDGSYVRFTVIKRIKADRTQDEGFVRMFKDEARITSELHHAKIGTVYDFGRVGDEWFLALEYVPGVDVRYVINQLRERGQRVPVRVALRIVVDVLEALEYAHTKKDTFGKRMGIVHRDVNPRNVMVSIRGEVKLIDFGVAKATDRLERTQTDHVKGKFSYMAPEQISGLAIDHRADVYAVGLLLHELLSGVSPYHGLNQVQILHRMLAGRTPPLPALSELPDSAPLEAIQARALAQSPSDRYASAAEMAEDVRALAARLGGLPSNDQLAAFVAAMDPALVALTQAKMEAYARAENSSPIRVDPAQLREAVLPDSASTLGPAAAPDPDGFTVTRIGVLGGSLVLASVVSGTLAAVVVTVLLVGGFLYLRPDPTPAPVPVPVPSHAEPAPAPVADPAPTPPPVPGSAPAPLPADPAPGRPRPRPGSPSPDPAPVEAAPEPAPPEPGPSEPGPPEPAAVAPAPVEPAPTAPSPDPVAVDTGFLNVLSDPRGAVVRVDGAEVGRTPLERFKVPVGAHTVEVQGLTCSPRAVTIRKSVVASVSCR